MLDTLKCVKLLEEAGATRQYAETEVYVMSEMIGSSFATKKDFADLRTDFSSLRTEFSDIRASTKRDIEELRTETRHEFSLVRSEIRQLELKFESLLAQQTNKFILAMTAVMGLFMAFDKLFFK